MLRGTVVLLLLSLNLMFWGTLVLLLSLFKLVAPAGVVRRRVVLLLVALGERWVEGNNRIVGSFLPIQWEIEGIDGLRRDARYLIFANHISWADIFVVFRALHRRVAFIRFFIKQELIWLPLVGQAAWAMEFPFMKRYSADYLARNPEKRGKDLETTRRACERYRLIPVAILNFLEGTRFTLDKHAEQDSPYRYLLRPRAGGAAFVLASLGDQLDGVLDLTIAYPGHVITAWQFISGRVPLVRVRVRQLQVPQEMLGAVVAEPGAARDRLKAWIHEVWMEKDRFLESAVSAAGDTERFPARPSPPTPTPGPPRQK
ncbi:MAG TPA: acetyltransferase [Thermoanaerobaculia bacterium]|nr:acetyltransferase [Thermoanaerobaculia bacterium]